MNASEAALASPVQRQRLDFHEVQRILPYKSPWLLIDRVDSCDDKEIKVIKAISGSEANMQAHMGAGPSIMPGVLQIELVNQALRLLMILQNMAGYRRDALGGAGVLVQVKAKFISPAYIGDVLVARVRPITTVGSMTTFEGEISALQYETGSVTERAVSKVSVTGAQVHSMEGQS